MNKYINDFLKNNINSITKELTKPQKDNVKEMISGLFKSGSPILRQLAQNEEVTTKWQSEKYGHHLERIDIADQVNRFALRRVLSEIDDDTPISYDLSDINKDDAEKMEKISEVFDGSERRKANGYFIAGLGIMDVPVRLDVHDNHQETINQIRKRIIKETTAKTEEKGIWIFDRGNDSGDLFRYLKQKELKFIVRLQRIRNILIRETGEMVKLKDLVPGRYNIYIKNRQGNKFDLDNEYLLIIHNNLKDKEPIRLICSKKLKEKSNSKLVDIYLKRWTVEKIFKNTKSQFDLEKIRVMKWKRLCNLVSLIQFVMTISTLLYQKIKDASNLLLQGINLLYQKFIKIKSLTYNLHSFISFMKSEVVNCKNYDKKPPDKENTSLFDLLPKKFRMF